jgi:hypothetical protein
MTGSTLDTATAGAPPRRGRREIRAFFVAIAVLMTLIALAGFWPSYFGRILSGGVQRHWIIHLHALIFSGWLLLLMAQVLLVFRRRTALHRRLGRFGIVYGGLVLLMGLAASIASPVLHIRAGEWTLDRAATFLIYPLGDMVLFAALFGAGIAYRRKPEVHKRLLLLATVALLFAPVGRMEIASDLLALLVWLFPLLLGMAYDFWARRRVHPTYLIGLIILLTGAARMYFERSEGWLRVGRAILHNFVPGAGEAG